jgi:hypothetical protein
MPSWLPNRRSQRKQSLVISLRPLLPPVQTSASFRIQLVRVRYTQHNMNYDESRFT